MLPEKNIEFLFAAFLRTFFEAKIKTGYCSGRSYSPAAFKSKSLLVVFHEYCMHTNLKETGIFFGNTALLPGEEN